MRNSDAKKYFNSWRKYFLAWHFIENQVFTIFALFPCFSVFSLFKLMQLVCLVMQSCSLKRSRQKVYIWSTGGFLLLPEKILKTSQDVFKEVLGTIFGRCLDDVFKEVLRTSCGKRLGDVLEKGRHFFHFKPIYDIFETKIKTFLRRLCDVIVSDVIVSTSF